MDRSELQALVTKTWLEAEPVSDHPLLRRLQAGKGLSVRAAQIAVAWNPGWFSEDERPDTIEASSPGGLLLVPYHNNDGLVTGVLILDAPDDPGDWLGIFEDAFAAVSGEGSTHEKTLICSSWREAVSVNAMTGYAALAAANEGDVVKLAAARKNAIVVISGNDHIRREARRAGLAVVEPPDGYDSWELFARHKGLDEGGELFNEKLAEALEDLRAAIPAFLSGDLPQGGDKPHLWENVIPQGSLGVLFGAPGAGKSFAALGLALAVASGQDFLGRRTTSGPAVYVAGEGGEDLPRRIEAWRLENGVQGELPLAVVPRAAQLDRPGEVERLAEAIDSVLDEPPKLLVLDTLARCFSGDENSARDMGRFISACDWLKTRFPGLAVLIIHHSGKADQQSMRGSSALLGAADFAAVLMAQQGRPTAAGRRLVLRCVKQKDLAPHEDVELLLSQKPLSGLDPYGRPSSSCVLRLQDDGKKDRPSAGVSSVLDALQEAAALSDDEGGGVPLSGWRAAYYATVEDMTADSKRRAFNRGKTDLLEGGFVWQDGKLFYSKEDTLTL